MSRFGGGGGRYRGNGGRGRGGRAERALAEYPFIAETRDLLAKVQNRGVRGDWEDIVDRGLDILQGPFAIVLQYFLEVDLEDTWVYVVKDKPPWNPMMVLSIGLDNEKSCTDQGFNPMLRVQLEALSSLTKTLSYGENPGPARALQIVRLIHDMFFATPRNLPPGGCVTSTASAEEARKSGIEAAKALYQECVELINNGVQEGGAAAWDESGGGGGMWGGGSSGWSQGFERGHSTAEHFGSDSWGGPSRSLQPMNSAPPSFGMKDGQMGGGPSPPLQTAGRGPPPSMRPQNRPIGGAGLRTSGRGPPPNMRSGSSIDGPQFNGGPPGLRPNQGINAPGRGPPPGFGPPGFNSPSQPAGLNSQRFNSSAPPTGLPGQPPPFGSMQPSQQEFPLQQQNQNPFASSPGLPGQPNPFAGQTGPPGFGVMNPPSSGSPFKPGTLQPPQRPAPMPGMRGRGPRPLGRGPPPNMIGRGRGRGGVGVGGGPPNQLGFSPSIRPISAQQSGDPFDWSMGTNPLNGLGRGNRDDGWAMGTGGQSTVQSIGGFGGGSGFGQSRPGDAIGGSWNSFGVNSLPKNDRLGGNSSEMGGEHWRSAC